MNQLRLENWVENNLARKRIDPNNDFEQLSKLTIVIPTYERHIFILRQAVYWAYSGANIIIVDGSSEPLSEKMQRALAELPSFRYLYASDSFVNRLKLASTSIQTPYVVTLGDDEFLLKNTLCQLVARLDDDAGLVACLGQTLGFKRSKTGKSVDCFDAGYTFWRYAVSNDSVRGRLMHAMATYNAATCYAVLRRDVWSEGWGDMRAWSSPYAGELHQAITTYLYGKLATVDEVCLLRSSENAPVTNTVFFNRKLSFKDWWHAPQYAAEREDFIVHLAKKAKICSVPNAEESRRVVEQAVATYLVRCAERRKWAFLRILRDSLRSAISKTLRRLMSPESLQALKLGLQKIVNRNLQGVPGRSVDGGSSFSGSGVANHNYQEIQSIKSLVLEFHEVCQSEG